MHRSEADRWWLECFKCGRTTSGLQLKTDVNPRPKGSTMPLIPETDALRLVQAEYREMPGLRLTLEQAQRLWNLDRPTCERTLQALVDRRFLDCTPAGKYVWTGSGSPAQDDFPRRVHAFAATGRA